ncbi:MAG: hypothetical protein FVQ85_14985 [Planctomycetes bacterium]|nr:hypothetical protein [Planctomycetota bacterium]
MHQLPSDEERLSISKQIKEKLAKLNLIEIKDWFELVDLPDTSEATVIDIIGKIRSYIGYLTLPVATHRLYRCRPLNKDENPPVLLSGLLSPPIKKTKQGRCNFAEKPVLYVSDNPSILSQECHIAAGQQFVILQFNHLPVPDVKEDITCMLLGIEPTYLFKNNPAIESVEKFRVEFFGSDYNKVREIERQLHKYFVRDDDPSGLTYKLTAHLCDHLFFKNQNLEAIFYPSIATNGVGNNYAIKPGAIDKAYEPVKAGLYELSQDGSAKQVDGAILCKEGEIQWGKDEAIDSPIPIGIKQIDPNDPDIYIAPWKK